MDTLNNNMSPQQNAKKALKLLHPNWGDDLRNYLQAVADGKNLNDIEEPFADEEMLTNGKFRKITGIFSDEEMDAIRRAFEGDQSVGQKSQDLKNGTVYICSRCCLWEDKGRDVQVQVNICDNGTISAFFSAEYPGYHNGDYYLLLNPTTALFYQQD